MLTKDDLAAKFAKLEQDEVDALARFGKTITDLLAANVQPDGTVVLSPDDVTNISGLADRVSTALESADLPDPAAGGTPANPGSGS